MKIFQNKIPKTWKSTGITISNGQMEMSNFSFAEEFFTSTSNKFLINIIGKNIIGNGALIVSIYKDSFLVWQEEFIFKNNSFSKKTIEIEEESGKDFKIVLSRGRSSKGKLLINSVVVNQMDNRIEDKPQAISEVSQPEDEPIFSNTIENKKDELKKPQEPIVEKKKRKSPEPKVKKEVKKKKKSPPRPRVSKKELVTDTADIIQEIDATPEVQVEPTRPEKNNIWIHIIDFSTISDERDIFKYINQISFGKGKQTFLIKINKDSEVNIPNYDHVSLFDENYDIKNKLIELNPNKITFTEQNLNKDLFEIIKNILSEQ